MSRKVKLHNVTVDDQTQAEGALAEMAALERKIQQALLTMRDDVDAIKVKAQAFIAPLEARLKEIGAAVKKWSTMNKSVLFSERKSLDLAFGTVGFKAATKIQQMNGVSEEETLAKLKQYGFLDGIRTSEEVNKEAMEKWPEERLALVGLVRRPSDTFYCKLKQEKIGTGAP